MTPRSTLVFAVTLMAAHAAQGQPAYPSKPIRVIAPSTAGSTQDILARLIGAKLGENLKQPVIIENRTGAAGILGTMLVAKATPDGYTLLLSGPGLTVNEAVRDNLPYNTARDFRGVAQIGFNTSALLVNPSLGIKSVKELIAYANERPGKVFFGSSVAGSSTYMTAERFRMAAGIKTTHVGFKGQPEFLLEIAAGRVHYGVSGIGAALSFIRNGQLLPLAVTTPKRSPQLPDVPSASEVIPAWGRDGSHGFLAPAQTPRAIVNFLNKEITRVLETPEVRERLSSLDFNLLTATPEEYDKSLAADIATFKRIAREGGLRVK